ncbi:hypothetical protein L3Q82_021052 [Scortum barcoo]|uniref:Uncharacterized protein n=1 Tax=Scortum barcoo TaxID=214431 RepID=A0ACB8X4Q8_9TELE|nr:hypothetical protein L3Q82_021052 [Scortum barcoo]
MKTSCLIILIRDGEPPLIKGWIPFIGKALEFGRDAQKFLEEHKKKFGDIFTVQIAGKYMTFIMDPRLYPNVIKHGRQLDFHEFANKVAPITFGYPPVINRKFPGLKEQISRSFQFLQGDNLTSLTDSMMGNLMLVFRQDHLDEKPSRGGWKTSNMYDFCNSVMFEATFLTIYGKPASTSRHSGMAMLREDFVRFDNMFPLLIAQIPIWLLGQTRTIRKKLINYFLPHRMSCWSNGSKFIRWRSELLQQYDTMRDVDRAEINLSLVPMDYRNLKQVFIKEQASSLPPHRPYAGAIDLLYGSTLPSSKLYNPSKPEKEVVETYIVDSLATGPPLAHHFAILWASVGNTVPASFWAMYYLVSHPEALEVVRQEIFDVLKLSGAEFSSNKDVKLSREQLEKLLYLESAINESLRLSSASMNIRVAQEDFSLRLDSERSVAVRRGDIIALYPQSMHMDPEIYEEPETFRFDRYIQDGREKTDFYKEGQKLRYYHMPFGSGSSMCPGRYFAINEIKQFLCLLLLYFDLQLEEGQPRVNVDYSRAGLGILLPASDVRFRYRLRRV